MEKYIAMCGLDCAKCEAFIATKNNDDILRKRVAKEWTERYKTKDYNRPVLSPEQVNCRGCLSDGPIYLYCRECRVRKCGLSRGIKGCKECQDYKCSVLLEKQSHFWNTK